MERGGGDPQDEMCRNRKEICRRKALLSADSAPPAGHSCIYSKSIKTLFMMLHKDQKLQTNAHIKVQLSFDANVAQV